MKTIHFLGGIPRSGSTLLGSLLNQHPEIYTSPTSPLGELLVNIDYFLNGACNGQYNFGLEQTSYNVYSSIIPNFYNHISKPIILDKHRCWGSQINRVKQFVNYTPKFIANYRSIPEVITSYISLIDRTGHYDNFIDNHLREKNVEINNTNRADFIWSYCISSSYTALVKGINTYPELVHLVEYNELVENPKEELNKIYKFLEVDPFENNLSSIENTCGLGEKDEFWGLKDLHVIRPNISKISQNPIDVLGEETVKLYSKFNL